MPKPNAVVRCWLAGASVLLLPLALYAELPVWEFGLGVGGVSIPNYRGSDERIGYALPLPYLVYRGDAVRIDREGVRGQVFQSNRVRFNISAAAGPPAKSEADGARAGMPELDPTIEIGPALEIRLGADTARNKWSVVAPLRGVIATDLRHTQSLGWVFSPYLRYQPAGLGGDWDADFSLGPVYASERFHDYYYGVEPAFATAARPAYNASKGYSGTRLTIAISKRFPNYWIGMFARYDNLNDAVFDESPLTRSKHSLMIGGGIAWILARSGATSAGEAQ
jgi:MipA family protein